MAGLPSGPGSLRITGSLAQARAASAKQRTIHNEPRKILEIFIFRSNVKCDLFRSDFHQRDAVTHAGGGSPSALECPSSPSLIAAIAVANPLTSSEDTVPIQRNV